MIKPWLEKVEGFGFIFQNNMQFKKSKSFHSQDSDETKSLVKHGEFIKMSYSS